jgi:hypothetical protein
MPDFKGIAKGGWHPKGKDGTSKESWRSDNKGINQVAGWIGRGKDPNEKSRDHVSRPLSTLKDPAAFGPPPKNVNYHGGAALPDQITPDTRRLGGRDICQAAGRGGGTTGSRRGSEAKRPSTSISSRYHRIINRESATASRTKRRRRWQKSRASAKAKTKARSSTTIAAQTELKSYISASCI